MDKHFPYDVTDELGAVQFCEERCPGVYFVSCVQRGTANLCREFYLVEKDAPAISRGVKRMGRQLADNPCLLAYVLEDVSGGQKLVEYEAGKAANGTARLDSAALHSIALDGMEVHPEYFGTYPVPYHTPWGYTLRHKSIDNGVYWIETDQCRRILAVCYPLHDELSDAALTLSVQERRDREEGLDHTMGYLFFSEEASCIPVFELMQARRHWERSGVIKKRALENAIWRCYPEYAIEYNIQEAAGQHDFTGLLLQSLGQNVPLSSLDEKMIAISHEADIHFCTLMD